MSDVRGEGYSGGVPCVTFLYWIKDLQVLFYFVDRPYPGPTISCPTRGVGLGARGRRLWGSGQSHGHEPPPPSLRRPMNLVTHPFASHTRSADDPRVPSPGPRGPSDPSSDSSSSHSLPPDDVWGRVADVSFVKDGGRHGTPNGGPGTPKDRDSGGWVGPG